MKIKIDPKLIDEGYITCRNHPTCGYVIYNYTARTQYEQYWTEQTKLCRGLILDKDGAVIARPLEKFFNIGEYNQHTHLGKLPNYTYFDVFEKMDGSLGILYTRPDGKVGLATRGSFESPQALKGQEILNKKYPNIVMNPKYTYLLEIVYPENRIVVDYEGQEDLVLLSIIEDN